MQRAQMYTSTKLTTTSWYTSCSTRWAGSGHTTLLGRHLGAVNSINIGRIAARQQRVLAAGHRHRGGGASRRLLIDVRVPRATSAISTPASWPGPWGADPPHAGQIPRTTHFFEEFFTTGIYRPCSAEDTLATSSLHDISAPPGALRLTLRALGRAGSHRHARPAQSAPALCIEEVRLRRRHVRIADRLDIRTVKRALRTAY